MNYLSQFPVFFYKFQVEGSYFETPSWPKISQNLLPKKQGVRLYCVSSSLPTTEVVCVRLSF